MKKKCLLFSSTRQWNPGDEIIYFGIRNILRNMNLSFNPILYNRHPLIKQKVLANFDSQHASMPNIFDNSFLFSPLSEKSIDYVIFAGTPEWNGFRVTPLYDLIKKQSIPFSLIGVGCKANLSDKVKVVIKNYSELILARDNDAFEVLKEFGATLEVCPALFSSSWQSVRRKKKKIGISFQGHGYMASPSHPHFQSIMSLYKTIIRKWETTIICHNYIDYLMAEECFSGEHIVYSSYAEDYFDLYDTCDVVIGTRIHGSGLASSLGIPNILIPHDKRANTAKLFLSIISSPEDAEKVLDNLDVEGYSSKIIRYKEEKLKDYQKHFKQMSLFDK